MLGDIDSKQVRSRSYVHVQKDETTGMNSRKLCILKRAYFLSRYMGFLTQLQAQRGQVGTIENTSPPSFLHGKIQGAF